MRLYHATKKENKDSILEFGLIPQSTDKLSSSDDRIRMIGVFGFDNEEDAISFGSDNSCGFGFVVFSFDAYEFIEDPEYNGEAKFIKTASPIKAEICFESEEYL